MTPEEFFTADGTQVSEADYYREYAHELHGQLLVMEKLVNDILRMAAHSQPYVISYSELERLVKATPLETHEIDRIHAH